MSIHQFITRVGLKSFGGGVYGGYAPTVAAEVRPEHGRMRISGTCTTGNLDRSREIVVPAGVDWSEYRVNPIFTIGHGWRDPAKIIGRCEVDGQFSVRQKAYGGTSGWDFTAQLFKTGPNAALAAESMDAVDSGALRGVSLGFRFIDPDARQVTANDGLPALQINRSKPFEITLVPTPDNPDAIVRIVEKGLDGRRLSAPLMSIFRPLVPKTKLHGFTPNRRTKAMTQDPAQQTTQGVAQSDPTASGQPQPTGPAMPSQKPSIALMMALEQYIMGLIRLCNDQLKVQEADEMKQLLPAVILHLSDTYRALANTHQQIQMKDQTFPNLLGHGGMLASPPTPDGMPGGLGFGDGLDGANGAEINAGMAPSLADPSQVAPPPDDGTETTSEGSGTDTQGAGGDDGDLFAGLEDDETVDAGGDDSDVTDQSQAGEQEDGQTQADTATGEDDGDNTDQPKPKPGKKPFPPKNRQKSFEVRGEMVQRVREKGQAAAVQRADALLSAFAAEMRREYGATDMNWLRWGADNVTTAKPEQLQALSQWMRQKAMENTIPQTKPLDERAELERYVAEELARRTEQV